MNGKVIFDDFGIAVLPLPGETISELATRNNIFINQPCGGRGRCGKCTVLVNGKKELACTTKAFTGMHIKFLQNEEQLQILETSQAKIGETQTLLKSVAIAIDIGTTTIVVYLVNKDTGLPIAVTSALNPQAEFGADVISRISYVMDHETGLEELHDVLFTKLNKMILEVLAKVQVSEKEVHEIFAAGNSTMEHLFAGISPISIGKFPFKPQFYNSISGKAGNWGLTCCSDATIRLLPNIAGFVGGDIVSGIVYSRMTESKKLSLFIDTGTNNEMVLGNSDFLVCCSTAAGPALEGAKISQGMRASSGAIEKFSISNDKEVILKTINNTKPFGICGSGLVDIIAELFKNGIITPSGRFAKQQDIKEKTLARRLIGIKASERHFVLTDFSQEGMPLEPEVSLTQKDIREFQLAKSAIATGIAIMLEEVNKKVDDLDQVFIGGAFGNYLDFNNAKTIGLFPDVPAEKIISLGNSAGMGVCLLLKDQALWHKIKTICGSAKHLELAAHPKFQDIFVANMSLGNVI